MFFERVMLYHVSLEVNHRLNAFQSLLIVSQFEFTGGFCFSLGNFDGLQCPHTIIFSQFEVGGFEINRE